MTVPKASNCAKNRGKETATKRTCCGSDFSAAKTGNGNTCTDDGDCDAGDTCFAEVLVAPGSACAKGASEQHGTSKQKKKIKGF